MPASRTEASKAIASARLMNDKVDACTLAQLLRVDLLGEAWIAPLQLHCHRSGPPHLLPLDQEDTDAMALGDRIRALRKEAGLSRAELGDKIGIDPVGTFAESGRASLTRSDTPVPLGSSSSSGLPSACCPPRAPSSTCRSGRP